MSVAKEAKSVYDADFKAELEAKHFGEFVAIEPESREAFVATTFIESAMKAKSAYPDRKSFVLRIGHEAAIHIGAATK